MPPRGRPRKGDHRIDAAIDHFAVMGYTRLQIHAAVDDLLKVYGAGIDAMHLLEEGCYQVVQDKLFEMEEEEKQKEDALQLLEYHQHQDGQQVEDEPPQHQQPAADEEVEDPMLIEPQNTIEPADDVVEHPMLIEPPAREAAEPMTRRPCYGWLSESEDEEEEEEQPIAQKHEGG